MPQARLLTILSAISLAAFIYWAWHFGPEWADFFDRAHRAGATVRSMMASNPRTTPEEIREKLLAEGILLTPDETAGFMSSQAGLVLAFLAMGLVYTVCFFTWKYRAYRNLTALRAEGQRFSPGGAVGWYFCPIANIWKPCQAMNDIWHGSDPRTVDQPGPVMCGMVMLWWLAPFIPVLLALRVNWFATVPVGGKGVGWALIVSASGNLAQFALTLVLVWVISLRQLRRHELVKGLPESPSAYPPAAGSAGPSSPWPPGPFPPGVPGAAVTIHTPPPLDLPASLPQPAGRWVWVGDPRDFRSPVPQARLVTMLCVIVLAVFITWAWTSGREGLDYVRQVENTRAGAGGMVESASRIRSRGIQRSLPGRHRPPRDRRTADPIDRQLSFLLAFLVAELTYLACFFAWKYRAYSNLAALRAAGQRFSPAGAVGWYFCPVANIWKPWQAMNDIWQGSDPRKGGGPAPAASGWVALWWLGPLVPIMLGIGVGILQALWDPLASNEATGMFVSGIAANLTSLVLTVIIVWVISLRQVWRAALLQGGQVPPGRSPSASR